MKEKMTLIFFSGSMDKAIAMLTLATTGVALGMEVSVFATFWGLNFFKKKRKFRNKNLIQKLLELMLPTSQSRLPLSSMNMAGVGPIMMDKLIMQTKSASVDQLYKTAVELGVKFYACSASCHTMGIDKANLTDTIQDIVGAATFLNDAKDAKINLFI